MFLLISILAGLAAIVWFYREGQAIGLNRILGMLYFIAYTVVYLYVPPFLEIGHQYIGKTYELVPIVCFYFILQPDPEEASVEQKAMTFFAWCGLLFITCFLLYFKMNVW
ncbi:hypothetical protein BK412_02300 [Vibrio campbellii]|uniref:hypothetical protein n=1 Tax=Vibrio campbellii TaxID=680 RepID=UPI0009BFB55B|nr:hypothetical protein [Vibrio campbellii]OQQ06256.1 hypothetical protein BK412_02300 [Vibrio campbellii]